MQLKSLPHKFQSGIAMIESLVALLVLALGVLGLAGLQTRTLTETRLTNSRAIALRMAGDLQERMMLNNGAKAAKAIGPYAYLTNWGAPGAATDCNANACSVAQLAAFDLRQWKTTLAAALPAGDASIYQSPDDPDQYGILIGWTDNLGARATDDLVNYSAPLQVTTNVAGAVCPPPLTCHLIMIRP